MRALLLLVAACGAREPAPKPDFGPPVEPIDPIACPAATLEKFASRLALPISITNEQIVDAARIDKVPCKRSEPDDACLARARQRPVPSSYEVAGVTIMPDDTRVEGTYKLDGRILTEEFPDLTTFIAKLKAFAADKHEVVVMNTTPLGDGAGRHAAVAYKGVGGRQRRIGTITWKMESPAAEEFEDVRERVMTEARVAADHDALELRDMTPKDDGSLVITVTCGAGAG